MRSRFLEIVFSAGLSLAVVGCQTSHELDRGDQKLANRQYPLGTLTLDLPGFRTLEDLKKFGEPHDETERFYLFEHKGHKLAIIVSAWGADYWNVVVIYAYDELRQQWIARGLLNPEVKGVQASFDKSNGAIEIRSGKGALILRTHLNVWPPRPTRDW